MCNSCSERIINWDQYVEQVQKVQGMFLSLATIDDNDVLNKLTEELDSMKENVSCQEIHYRN